MCSNRMLQLLQQPDLCAEELAALYHLSAQTRGITQVYGADLEYFKYAESQGDSKGSSFMEHIMQPIIPSLYSFASLLQQHLPVCRALGN
jgi:hypothetical protein